MEFLKRNLIYLIYGLFLIIFTIYLILDTFVITRVYSEVSDSYEISDTDTTTDKGDVNVTSTTYEDDNINIEIITYREYDTNIYVAYIKLNDVSLLKTALANNSYGKNVVAKTSEIAESNNAILAINGDYYGVQESGYVLKNGIIYRNTAKSEQYDLAIYEDGHIEVFLESAMDINELKENGVYNILSFGPVLIADGEIAVTTSDEVDKSMTSNPRTAIGMINEEEYVFVVSDGRTSESSGLSLYELATFMRNLGVTFLYNLDGGGSSTMYFNGEVINNPTTNGKTIKERKVSDIVYIGY